MNGGPSMEEDKARLSRDEKGAGDSEGEEESGDVPEPHQSLRR